MARRRQSRLAYLDTHVAAWLYDGLVEKLSEAAKSTIETSLLRVSPLIELELDYLHEIGRLTPRGAEVIDTLQGEVGVRRSDPSLQPLVQQAGELHWTRDPFDRLITAEALLEGAVLITKDRTIRAHYKGAVW